jgi:hypothetical protein
MAASSAKMSKSSSIPRKKYALMCFKWYVYFMVKGPHQRSEASLERKQLAQETESCVINGEFSGFSP